MNTVYSDTLDTPAGLLEIQANNNGVFSILFVEKPTAQVNINTVVEEAKQQLHEYFLGKRQQFSFIMVAQGTEFQHKVWQALTTIEYGETASYSDIATTIGKPNSVRAVGAANGKNPLSIVVPCHRVIGKNGSLTGYAGGLNRKLALLELEEKFRYTFTQQ